MIKFFTSNLSPTRYRFSLLRKCPRLRITAGDSWPRMRVRRSEFLTKTRKTNCETRLDKTRTQPNRRKCSENAGVLLSEISPEIRSTKLYVRLWTRFYQFIWANTEDSNERKCHKMSSAYVRMIHRNMSVEHRLHFAKWAFDSLLVILFTNTFIHQGIQPGWFIELHGALESESGQQPFWLAPRRRKQNCNAVTLFVRLSKTWASDPGMVTRWARPS